MCTNVIAGTFPLHHNVLGGLREWCVTWETKQETSSLLHPQHWVTSFPKLKTWDSREVARSSLPWCSHSVSARRCGISGAAGLGKPHPINYGQCAREPGHNQVEAAKHCITVSTSGFKDLLKVRKQQRGRANQLHKGSLCFPSVLARTPTLPIPTPLDRHLQSAASLLASS